MGQAASAPAPASASAPASVSASAPASAPAPASASASASASDQSVLYQRAVELETIRMTDRFGNEEQRRVLMSHGDQFMEENDKTKDAKLLRIIGTQICSDPGLIAKFPIEKLGMYQKVLEKIIFVALILNRQNPKKPSLHVAKSIRGKQLSFFQMGFYTLVRLCFFELVTIVPESPWTVRDAALFLQTLESIDPDFSRLFTKVFDDLIDHTELMGHFSNTGAYLSYPAHFSNTVFLSLSKVVRPKPYPSEDSETIVQHNYGLKYHYRFPMDSKMLFNHCRRVLLNGGEPWFVKRY
jgi:hypothetical protein